MKKIIYIYISVFAALVFVNTLSAQGLSPSANGGAADNKRPC